MKGKNDLEIELQILRKELSVMITRNNSMKSKLDKKNKEIEELKSKCEMDKVIIDKLTAERSKLLRKYKRLSNKMGVELSCQH